MSFSIELGAGETPDITYDIHVDIRELPHIEIVKKVEELELPANEISRIKMNQFLEHLMRDEATRLLTKARTWLIPKGTIEIWVPDIEYYVKMFNEGSYSSETFLHQVYGAQNYDDNLHRWGYTKKSLTHLGLALGYEIAEAVCKDGSIKCVLRKPV